MFKKTLSLTVIFCFFLTTLGPYPQAHADTVLGLPAPGTMVNLSPAYEPVIIKGLTVHKDNPFLFDFIVDIGQDRMSGEPLKKEGEKLIKYFLASLAIPDKDVWVNLSPYEKNRMIPEVLGQTDMGRDLLEQDYILKQITASLIYPEKQLGKTFWDKVYAKAQQTYGTTQIPVNTFNKVWIMADRAEVFEHNQTAFVVDSHLKVMLEEDYLALKKNTVILSPSLRSRAGSAKDLNKINSLRDSSATPQNDVNALGSQVIRQIVLPELEKEVNTGKNFANLRQIFNSIILSSWYKKNLQQALLNQVYADKSKVKGINLNDPSIKQQIYEQYLKAYKKGVFNYIKEDINTVNGETIPRKYFSGGMDEGIAANPAMTTDPAKLDRAMIGTSNRLMNLLAGFLSTKVKINPATIKFNGGPTVTSGQMIEFIDFLKRNAARGLGGYKAYVVERKSDEVPLAISSWLDGARFLSMGMSIMSELIARSPSEFEIKDKNFMHGDVWTIKSNKVDEFKQWLDVVKEEILKPIYNDQFVARNITAIITPANIEFKRRSLLGSLKSEFDSKSLVRLIDATIARINILSKSLPKDISDGRMMINHWDGTPSPFYYRLAAIMQEKGWQGKLERLPGYGGYQLSMSVGKENANVNALLQWLEALKQSIQSPYMGTTTFDAAMTGKVQGVDLSRELNIEPASYIAPGSFSDEEFRKIGGAGIELGRIISAQLKDDRQIVSMPVEPPKGGVFIVSFERNPERGIWATVRDLNVDYTRGFANYRPFDSQKWRPISSSLGEDWLAQRERFLTDTDTKMIVKRMALLFELGVEPETVVKTGIHMMELWVRKDQYAFLEKAHITFRLGDYFPKKIAATPEEVATELNKLNGMPLDGAPGKIRLNATVGQSTGGAPILNIKIGDEDKSRQTDPLNAQVIQNTLVDAIFYTAFQPSDAAMTVSKKSFLAAFDRLDITSKSSSKVAVSPNGRYIFRTDSQHKSSFVYDLTTEFTYTIPSIWQTVEDANFSPDGTKLAISTTNDQTNVLDLRRLRADPFMMDNTKRISFWGDFSPDSKLLVGYQTVGEDKKHFDQTYVIDLQNGQPKFIFKGSVDFSESGKYMIVSEQGNRYRQRLYDGATGKLVKLPLRGDEYLKLSPDETHILTSSSDYAPRLIRITDQQVIKEFPRRSSVDFLDNSFRVLVTTYKPNLNRKIVYIEDIEHETVTRVYDFAWQSSVSPDKRRAVIVKNYDKAVNPSSSLYNMQTGEFIEDLPTKWTVDTVYFSPKGRFIVVQGQYGKKVLVEARTGLPILNVGSGEKNEIYFSDDERFVITFVSGKISMLDAQQLIRQAKQEHDAAMTGAIKVSEGNWGLWVNASLQGDSDVNKKYRALLLEAGKQDFSNFLEVLISMSEEREKISITPEKMFRVPDVEGRHGVQKFFLGILKNIEMKNREDRNTLHNLADYDMEPFGGSMLDSFFEANVKNPGFLERLKEQYEADAAMVASSTYVYHNYKQFFDEQASRVSETGGFFDIQIKNSSKIRLRVSKITEDEITGLEVDKYNVVHSGQEVVIDRNEVEWAQEVDAAMSSGELGLGNEISINIKENAIFRVGFGKNFKVGHEREGYASVWEGWDRHLGDAYAGHPYNYLIKNKIVAKVDFRDGKLYVRNVSDAVVSYTISDRNMITDMAMTAIRLGKILEADINDGNFRMDRYIDFYKDFGVHTEMILQKEMSLQPGDIVLYEEAPTTAMGPLIAGQKVRVRISPKTYVFTCSEGRVIVFSGVGEKTRLTVQPSALVLADKAALANPTGGIDLNTSNGMQWKVSKDGNGVEMNIDPAMIERIRREGIDSLSPVILRMTPVTSIWSLVGLQAPVK
jgi:hypothetical protein